MADERFHGDRWFQKQVEQRIRRELRELQKQGTAPTGSLESLRGTSFYKDLFRKHARLFREERAAKFQAHKVWLEEDLRARTVRDAEWGESHSADTDEQLLEYVRQCSDGQKKSPLEREVLGGIYIRERFGSWPLVLHLAGLPLRNNMKLSPKTLKNYLQRQQVCAAKFD